MIPTGTITSEQPTNLKIPSPRLLKVLEKWVARSALRNCRPQLRDFLVRCKRGAAAFMASFGPFWLRFGVRVRVALGL